MKLREKVVVEGLPTDLCGEQTHLIYKEALKLFPNYVWLTKAMCLFWRRIGRYDLAIKVCSEAIAKGLKDGTKSGFEGRLRRLERESQKAQQIDSH
jgi:hypothetical protein